VSSPKIASTDQIERFAPLSKGRDATVLATTKILSLESEITQPTSVAGAIAGGMPATL
jgi:hypothetical protein